MMRCGDDNDDDDKIAAVLLFRLLFIGLGVTAAAAAVDALCCGGELCEADASIDIVGVVGVDKTVSLLSLLFSC